MQNSGQKSFQDLLVHFVVVTQKEIGGVARQIESVANVYDAIHAMAKSYCLLCKGFQIFSRVASKIQGGSGRIAWKTPIIEGQMQYPSSFHQNRRKSDSRIEMRPEFQQKFNYEQGWKLLRNIEKSLGDVSIELIQYSCDQQAILTIKSVFEQSLQSLRHFLDGSKFLTPWLWPEVTKQGQFRHQSISIEQLEAWVLNTHQVGGQEQKTVYFRHGFSSDEPLTAEGIIKATLFKYIRSDLVQDWLIKKTQNCQQTYQKPYELQSVVWHHGLNRDEPLIVEKIIRDAHNNPDNRSYCYSGFNRTGHPHGDLCDSVTAETMLKRIRAENPTGEEAFNQARIRLNDVSGFFSRENNTEDGDPVSTFEYLQATKKFRWFGPFETKWNENYFIYVAMENTGGENHTEIYIEFRVGFNPKYNMHSLGLAYRKGISLLRSTRTFDNARFY